MLTWTLDQLLHDPELRLRVIVGIPGPRPISWVHITEMQLPGPLLEGGEVILTAGVWLDAGETATVFIGALARANVSAIGFGLTERHPTTPAALIDACREHRLILFEVPLETRFERIVRTFVARSSRDGLSPLRAAIRHNQAFVSALGEGRGVGGVLEVLGKDLGAAVHLWDRGAQLIAGTAAATEHSVVAEAWHKAAQQDGRFALGGKTVIPIGPWEGREALVLIDRPQAEMSAADITEIEQAVSFIGVELGHRLATREAVRRFTGEVAEGLLVGTVDGIAARRHLAMLGFEPETPVFVAIASPEVGSVSLDAFDAVFAGLGMRSGSAAAAGRLVSFAQARPRDFDAEATGSAISRALGPKTYVGVGSLASEPAGLRRSLLEADNACRLAMRRRRLPRYATYSSVSSHLLLLALVDEDALALFRRAALQALLDHDAGSPVSLVETLRVFLDSSLHVTSAAARLGIHVNTLRHRLAKVEQLTGRDLRSVADLTDLHLALVQEEASSGAYALDRSAR